jgi:hypothetical protein
MLTILTKSRPPEKIMFASLSVYLLSCVHSNALNILHVGKLTNCLHSKDVSSFAARSFPLGPRCVSNPPINAWLPFVISDAVAFRATLLLCVIDLESQQQKVNSVGANLMAEVLSILGERVQDAQVICCDQTIGVVLNLAAVEVSSHPTANLRVTD